DKLRWDLKKINLVYNSLNQKGLLSGVDESRDSKGLDGFIVQSISPLITMATTSRPMMSESDLERRAFLEGRQVVVCYGGEDGFDVAKFLKEANPYNGAINFIVAPITLQYGKPAPNDGVLDTEIRQSHCVVALLDMNGFLKSEKAKREFRIILEHKAGKYIPMFLREYEKGQIIKTVKDEFGVDLSEIQYATWKQSRAFLDKLYDDIRKTVIFP
ncbi:MAG TPA: hypothetical protein VF360_05100, partial [Candidatus Methanoperedens sp.]